MSEPTKIPRAINFATFLHSISPSFLSEGAEDTRPAARFVELLGTIFDIAAERSREALLARYPASAPVDALPHLGADRRIIRGFAEPELSYRRRLRAFLATWRNAGGPYALLDQIAAYFTGYEVKLRLVDDSGNWFTRKADGQREYVLKAGNWDWDAQGKSGGGSYWSRGWLIIYPPADLWTEGVEWGEVGATWGSGRTWGSTATRSQVRTLRAIGARFKPLHAWLQWMIVAFDPDSFNPATPEPDGTWRYWSVDDAGVPRPGRLATARYMTGTRRLED